MQIIEALCTGNSRYKAGERLTPKGVVLHSIGTPQPSAQVLRDYWQRGGSAYVVHYMVDNTRILRCMPENFKCWHVGSPGNAQYLGIEMGEPSQIRYTSGARFTVSDLAAAQQYATAAYKNAVQLIAHLCRKYGWEPENAVWTHAELTRRKLSNTDHVDPQHLWDGLGLGYDLARLRKDVRTAMGGTAAPSAPATAERPTLRDGSSGTAVKTLQMKLIALGYSFEPYGADGAFGSMTEARVKAFQLAVGISADGIVGPQTWAALDKAEAPKTFTPYLVRITASSGLNVREGPGTDYRVKMSLGYGGAYTIVEERNSWGKLKSGVGWICLKYTAVVK